MLLKREKAPSGLASSEALGFLRLKWSMKVIFIRAAFRHRSRLTETDIHHQRNTQAMDRGGNRGNL